jgi:hypothetical protein
MKMQCRDLAEQAQIAEQTGWKSPALARGLAMTAIAASLAFATSAFADDSHHPQQAPEPGAVSTEPAAPAVQKMQDNVKKMQAQLDRIAARYDLYVPDASGDSPAPGTCPKCGMTLEPVLPEPRGGRKSRACDFRRRFWWTLPLTVPWSP